MDFQRARLLYKLVSKNQRISTRRHPLMSQNKAMKIFIFLFLAFWAVYLIFFGVMFAFALQETNYEPFDWINGGMVYFLLVDFGTRFILQETPAQEIKPYKLHPIPQNFLLNVFLMRMALRGENLFWFFFHVPFALFAIVKFYGFIGFFGYLLGWWLMYVLNGYWYLIWRTKMQRNILYLLIPASVYFLLIYFGFFFDEQNKWLFKGSMILGRAFCDMNVLAYLFPIACSVVLFFVNRKMQRKCVYDEIAEVERVTKVKSREMHWLNRFGVIGEYMKLEIKSAMRNKVVRAQFMIGVIYMLLFCFVFAFTNIYDNQPFMKTFICVYCFACLCTMTLTSVMCAEGNYIDLLMSRKESVLSLLKAKYYFNILMIVFPMLFMLMPIMEGKIQLIEALSCAFFATGCIFPFLFQLAVYNKTTINLNQKVIRSSGRNTKTQIIFSLAALLLPVVLMYILVLCFNDLVAAWLMLGLGIIGTLASPLWLRNIYHRFMLRRYINMEGFRDTRS